MSVTNNLKLFFLLLIFISTSSLAEEECVFDETAYLNFIKKYQAEHKNVVINKDNTLFINRDNEEIIVEGGGCVHMGMTIQIHSQRVFSEKTFLAKTLALSKELGCWLINTAALENAINKKLYKKTENNYFIRVDAMTVFEASFEKNEINILFYIN